MHPRFQTAFAQLADNLQSALAPILADHHFPAMLTAEQVSTLKNTAGLDEDALAFALLPLAAACAVPICPILTSARLRAALAATGISARIWSSWAPPCNKLCMLNKARLATPGYAAKKGSPPSPLTTRLAATVASL